MKKFISLLCFLSLFAPLRAQFTVTTDSLICYGGNDGAAHVSPSTGYLYHWNNGDSTANAFSLSAGAYTCIISDSQGIALDTLSVIISQPARLAFSHTVTNTTCTGAHNGIINVIGSGGIPPYSFSATKNFIDFSFATSGSISGLDSGMYHISMVDNYGCTITDAVFVGASSTTCVGVNEIPQLLKFTLQTNPVTDFANIIYELDAPLQLTFSVYDLSGKKLEEILKEAETKGPNNQPINVGNLASGIYILNISSDKGSFNIKLVKD